jgi:hypothetical protein
MRRDILMIIILLFSVSAMAQTTKQEVIASAGGYNTDPDNVLSISWTLGETIIPTFTSQDGFLILTHGFQQQLIITAINENPEDLGKVKIYPNPSSAVVNIQFDTPTDNEVLLYLLDAQGKLVKTDRIDTATTEKNINMEDLPSGIYYLRLMKGNHVNVYKVVKL